MANCTLTERLLCLVLCMPFMPAFWSLTDLGAQIIFISLLPISLCCPQRFEVHLFPLVLALALADLCVISLVYSSTLVSIHICRCMHHFASCLFISPFRLTLSSHSPLLQRSSPPILHPLFRCVLDTNISAFTFSQNLLSDRVICTQIHRCSQVSASV